MSLIVFKRTVVATGITLACFAGYAMIVVPLLEPEVVARDADVAEPTQDMAQPADRYLTEIQPLLLPNSWETATPKILRYRNTLLLFDDYQPQDDGTINIRPCTVIMRQSDQRTAEAINSSLVMRAPEGAKLKLSKPIGFGTADLGEPISGQLLGPIRISSRGKNDGSGRFDISTADVFIDRKLLQTTAAVDLKFEGSRAVGQELIVHLLPTNNNTVPDKPVGWAGMRSIELVAVDHLRLDVKADDDRPAPVDVACRGPLRIDFMDNTMTLEEDVKLKRHDPSGKIDTLDCDRLEMRFDKQLAEATQRVAKPKSDHKPMGNTPKLEVTSVVAEGRPVVLRATSRGAHVRSRRLAYDLKRGRFQLWSDDKVENDRVEVRIEDRQFVAKSLDCQLDADGEIARVNAQGPGEFTSSGLLESDSSEINAYWRDQLVLKREERLHHLTLVGNCWVAVNRESGIEAEVLHLWLEPEEQEDESQSLTPHPELKTLPRPLSVVGKSKSSASPFDMSALRPIELVALSSTPNRPNAPKSPVVLTTAGVVGRTDRLNARFVHLPPAPASTPKQGPATTLVTSNTSSSHVTGDARNSAQANDTGHEEKDSATHIEGRNLTVTLEVRGKEFTVGDLRLDDQIQVRHFDLANGDAPAFELRAKEMQVQTIEGQQVLTARGQPVQIVSEELRCLTTQLHVDQERSLVWTRQPGRMEVQVDRDANGRRLARPQTMTIDWDDGMTFDGRSARFQGQVEVVGPDQRLRAANVEVTLNRQLDAATMRRQRQQGRLDIKRVAATGGVTLEAREYNVDNQLDSIFLLRVPSVTVDRETGDLRASGPGRLTTIRDGFESAGLDQFASDDALRNRRGSSTSETVDPSATKTFLRVEFQREATGNLYRRVVEFKNRVQVLYGPVGSFNEFIKPNGPLRKDDLFMTCDQLAVIQRVRASNQRSGEKNQFDLVAQGNTVVEGQSFTAQGDQISYEQAKGQMILEGTGSTDAMLSHQARVGSPSSKTVARKILFWPATKSVQVEDARYLDLSNLGL